MKPERAACQAYFQRAWDTHNCRQRAPGRQVWHPAEMQGMNFTAARGLKCSAPLKASECTTTNRVHRRPRAKFIRKAHLLSTSLLLNMDVMRHKRLPGHLVEYNVQQVNLN